MSDHLIKDIDFSYRDQTLEMACKMAMGTIHELYDSHMQTHYVDEYNMDKLYKAVKILAIANSLGVNPLHKARQELAGK